MNNANSLGAVTEVPSIDVGHIQGPNGEVADAGAEASKRVDGAPMGTASGSTFIGTPTAAHPHLQRLACLAQQELPVFKR